MRTKKVNDNELRNILRISLKKLRSISEEEIKEMLYNAGYNYYGKDSNNKHKISLYNEEKRKLYNVCKQEFKTDKVEEFKLYFAKRINPDVIMSRKDLADYSGTTPYMIEKWDKIMLDKDIIRYSDIEYIIKNTHINKITKITKEEYFNHFINDNVIKIKNMFKSKSITESEFKKLLKEEAINIRKSDGDSIYLRMWKYETDKTNNDNYLYKEIMKLMGVS